MKRITERFVLVFLALALFVLSAASCAHTLDANAIAHRVEGVTGPEAELVELVWMPLTDAKQLDMPAVTGVMLEELDARIADGFGHDLPVPFYSMPRGRFKRELL